MKRSSGSITTSLAKRSKVAQVRTGHGDSFENENERQPLSQVLSTFSAMEHERFNAFRRCTFAKNGLCGYVSTCLVSASRNAQHKRKMGKKIGNSSVPSVAPSMNVQTLRPLSEYVAPDTSSQIIVAVTTIAKIYAQRLVKSARDLKTEKNNGDDGALLPENILEAYHQRVKAGIDPGFFMHGDFGSLRGTIRTPSLNALDLKTNIEMTIQAQIDCDNIEEKKS